MVKKLQKVVFFLSFMGLIAPSVLFAQGVNINDLGLGTPGILPSNPFYFFKEWGRSVRKTLALTDFSKVETQMNFLNEQAAEIQKISEIKTVREEAFERVLQGYSDGVDRLIQKLPLLSGLRGNKNFEKMLSTLIDRSVKHYDIIAGLMGRFDGEDSGATFNNHVKDVLARIADLLSALPDKAENQKQFTTQLVSALRSAHGYSRAMSAAQLLNSMFKVNVDRPLFGELLRVQGELLNELLGHLAAVYELSGRNVDAVRNFFNSKIGDAQARLEVLDMMRERTDENDLKSAMNGVREELLWKLSKVGVIDESQVNMLVAEINILTKKSINLKPTILERAKLSASNGLAALKEKATALAYGQLLTARSVLINGLTEAGFGPQDVDGELQGARLYFDMLHARMQQLLDISKEKKVDVQSALSRIEVRIVMVGDASSRDITYRELRGLLVGIYKELSLVGIDLLPNKLGL